MRDLAAVVEFWTGGPRPSRDGVRLIAARSILSSKAAMRGAFPAGLVHDPVVEIMMTVYIAGETSGPLQFDAACQASGVPYAVARRWIMALQQQGLVQLTTDTDGRSVSLTDQGYASTTAAIDAMLAGQMAILG